MFSSQLFTPSLSTFFCPIEHVEIFSFLGGESVCFFSQIFHFIDLDLLKAPNVWYDGVENPSGNQRHTSEKYQLSPTQEDVSHGLGGWSVFTCLCSTYPTNNKENAPWGPRWTLVTSSYRLTTCIFYQRNLYFEQYNGSITCVFLANGDLVMSE